MTIPSAASAGVAALPDVVYVTAGETTAIAHSELTANDVVPAGMSVTVDQWPLDGTLTPGASAFDFTPDADYYGPTTFTYRITGTNGTASADVVVVVISSIEAVSGRWSVRRPHSGPACSLGDGSEIGFYFREDRTFRLCDFTGSDVGHCEDWPVPSSVAVGDRALPLFGDWDQDGWDEPALFDPDTGLIERFDYGVGCITTGPCLDHDGTWDPGLAETEMPIAVPGVSGQQVLGYDWHLRQITSGAPPGQSVPVTNPTWPEVGDWSGLDGPLLGEWDGSTETFHFLIDGSGAGSSTLQPFGPQGPVTVGMPFSGLWSGCGTEAYFGIFDEASGFLGLYESFSLFEGAPSRPPVHVKVPVDPPDS
ncbi:MAG: Ig-like domain-containing protein [Acidobacteriota bacterium]